MNKNLENMENDRMLLTEHDVEGFRISGQIVMLLQSLRNINIFLSLDLIAWTKTNFVSVMCQHKTYWSQFSLQISCQTSTNSQLLLIIQTSTNSQLLLPIQTSTNSQLLLPKQTSTNSQLLLPIQIHSEPQVFKLDLITQFWTLDEFSFTIQRNHFYPIFWRLLSDITSEKPNELITQKVHK